MKQPVQDPTFQNHRLYNRPSSTPRQWLTAESGIGHCPSDSTPLLLAYRRMAGMLTGK